MNKPNPSTPPHRQSLWWSIISVWGSCLLWAVYHERISARPYVSASGGPGERFTHVGVLNLLQATFACLTALVALRVQRRGDWATLSWKAYRHFALIAFFHTAGSPIGYLAMSYLDYPLLILATACKMLPIMVVGTAMGRKYSWVDYASVALMTCGVIMYSASKILAGSGGPIIPGGSSELTRTVVGMALLMANLFFDGLVTNGQDTLYQTYRIAPYTMMAILNGFGALFLALFLSIDGLFRGHSSTVVLCRDFVARHPSVAFHVLAFCTCGALAQLAIYVAIRELGSFSTSIVTIARKFFTIAISVAVFGHVLAPLQWMGVGAVLLGFVVQMSLKDHGKWPQPRARGTSSVTASMAVEALSINPLASGGGSSRGQAVDGAVTASLRPLSVGGGNGMGIRRARTTGDGDGVDSLLGMGVRRARSSGDGGVEPLTPQASLFPDSISPAPLPLPLLSSKSSRAPNYTDGSSSPSSPSLSSSVGLPGGGGARKRRARRPSVSVTTSELPLLPAPRTSATTGSSASRSSTGAKGFAWRQAESGGGEATSPGASPPFSRRAGAASTSGALKGATSTSVIEAEAAAAAGDGGSMRTRRGTPATSTSGAGPSPRLSRSGNASVVEGQQQRQQHLPSAKQSSASLASDAAAVAAASAAAVGSKTPPRASTSSSSPDRTRNSSGSSSSSSGGTSSLLGGGVGGVSALNTQPHAVGHAGGIGAHAGGIGAALLSGAFFSGGTLSPVQLSMHHRLAARSPSPFSLLDAGAATAGNGATEADGMHEHSSPAAAAAAAAARHHDNLHAAVRSGGAASGGGTDSASNSDASMSPPRRIDSGGSSAGEHAVSSPPRRHGALLHGLYGGATAAGGGSSILHGLHGGVTKPSPLSHAPRVQRAKPGHAAM